MKTRRRLLVPRDSRFSTLRLGAALVVLFVAPAAAAPGPGGPGGKGKRDTTPPVVQIASLPAPSAATLVVSGSASDNVSVASVEVAVDGGPYAPAVGTGSWSFTVEMGALAAGTHTITALASDAAGNRSTAMAAFAVSAPVDTTPPVPAFSVPGPGANLAGTVVVSGSAVDNVAVSKVELSIDGGAYRDVQGGASWSTSLDTSLYPSGSHTLHARATDTSGNVGIASLSVSLANNAAPSISFTVPTSGAAVSGVVAVSGVAADDASVAKVEVGVDGGIFRPAQGTTAWTYSLDSSALTNGSHVLTARATDGAGRTATSTISVSVSNLAAPGSAQRMITPEGVTIIVDADVTGWTPQAVYDILKPNASQLNLLGPTLTVQVQTATFSSTASGVSGSPTNGYYNFQAKIALDARPDRVFSSRPDKVIAHEYGHAWTMYHLYLSQRGAWSRYLAARGLSSDPRVESTYTWSKAEMIADDYRLLFGTQKAQDQAAYLNPDIPDPRTVPGLKDFFVNVWSAP